MPTKKPKPFFDMTPAQKEALVRRLDRGLSPHDLKPLSKAETDQWQRLKRGPGRPPKPAAQKAIAVRVTFDPDLLARVDAFVKQHHLTRAQLLARGARLVLKKSA